MAIPSSDDQLFFKDSYIEARQQFLMSHGYKELEIEGSGLIMADVAIEFKKELNYGDIINISVAAQGFDKLGFDLLYKIEIIKGKDSILAGKAKTGMMCFDYRLHKRVAIPEEARVAFT